MHYSLLPHPFTDIHYSQLVPRISFLEISYTCVFKGYLLRIIVWSHPFTEIAHSSTLRASLILRNILYTWVFKHCIICTIV